MIFLNKGKFMAVFFSVITMFSVLGICKVKAESNNKTLNNYNINDVNGDGKVNSSDAILVLKDYANFLISGKNNLDIEKTDVNKDGKIDSKDAVQILIAYAENIVGNYEKSTSNILDTQDTSDTSISTEETTVFYDDSAEDIRGKFKVNDSINSKTYGEIHFSSYIPDSYDGSEPYALFVTLPGWEGLYFQGVRANLVEGFPFEANKYNKKMIIISTQLNDWGETSANMAIELTEYFIKNYNIDTSRVYLHGMSGGGETGSIIMGKRPELYTAYLETSSKWDGNLEVLAKAKTPVYMAIAENDTYYGSKYLKDAYNKLYELYKKQGLSDEEINKILVLDVKPDEYFTERGYRDQHAGGNAFSADKNVMGWLLGKVKK